jgi:hypothetical protein
MTRQTLAIDPSARAASIQPVSDGRLWRSVAAAVLLCVVTWSGAVLFLWLAQSWLLFRLGDSRADTAAMDPSVFSESSFVTADGLRLESVLLTHGPAEERYWILFCPPAGASTRVRRIQGHLQVLWRLGFNVFAFDYRGFGDNSGTPSEAGLYEDATAAYQSLTEVHGVAATHVVIAGGRWAPLSPSILRRASNLGGSSCSRLSTPSRRRRRAFIHGPRSAGWHDIGSIIRRRRRSSSSRSCSCTALRIPTCRSPTRAPSFKRFAAEGRCSRPRATIIIQASWI